MATNSRESATPKIPGGNSRELLSSRWEFLGVYKISNFYRVMHVVIARYCYRMSSVRPYVRLSVRDVDVPWAYRLDVSSKLITWIISLGSSLLGRMGRHQSCAICLLNYWKVQDPTGSSGSPVSSILSGVLVAFRMIGAKVSYCHFTKAKVADTTAATTEELLFCQCQARHLLESSCPELKTSCSTAGGSSRVDLRQAEVPWTGLPRSTYSTKQEGSSADRSGWRMLILRPPLTAWIVMPSGNFFPVLVFHPRFSVCLWHSTLPLLAVLKLMVTTQSGSQFWVE